MKIDWLKIIGTVAMVILVGLIGFGAYQYYFVKPIPVINNYVVQPGGNITQNQQQKVKVNRFAIGIFATNDKTFGVHFSLLF